MNNSINSAELDEGGNVYVSPVSNLESANENKKLSEWRILEKQMIKGDFGEKGSPNKQGAGQKVFEEHKGDKVLGVFDVPREVDG